MGRGAVCRLPGGNLWPHFMFIWSAEITFTDPSECQVSAKPFTNDGCPKIPKEYAEIESDVVPEAHPDEFHSSQPDSCPR